MSKTMSNAQRKAMFAKKGKSAIDFGDDPDIRHSHREHKQYSKEEPWEKSYRRKKKR